MNVVRKKIRVKECNKSHTYTYRHFDYFKKCAIFGRPICRTFIDFLRHLQMYPDFSVDTSRCCEYVCKSRHPSIQSKVIASIIPRRGNPWNYCSLRVWGKIQIITVFQLLRLTVLFLRKAPRRTAAFLYISPDFRRFSWQRRSAFHFHCVVFTHMRHGDKRTFMFFKKHESRV